MQKNFKCCLLAVMFLATVVASAQVTVGNGKVPEDFSVLELVNNELQGLRLPQMTTDQRNKLETETQAFIDEKTGEAMGLRIFNTDTKCVETWNGSVWISSCAMCGDIPCQYIECEDGNIPVPQFMAYNLGANPKYDTPKKQMEYLATHPFSNIDGNIYGGRYQWGRQNLPYAISTDGNYTLYTSFMSENNVYNPNNAINLNDIVATATYDALTGQINGQENNHVFVWPGIVIDGTDAEDWRLGNNGGQKDDLWGNGLPIGTVTDGGIPFNDKTYQCPVKSVNDPCPDGWRVPTQDEWERLGNYDCNPTAARASTQVTISNGVGTSSTGFTWVPVVCASGSCRNSSLALGSQSGYAIYKTDVWTDESFDKTNLIDADDPEPFMFLPAAGVRSARGASVGSAGQNGSYWSSSVTGALVHYLFLHHTIAVYPHYEYARAFGMSVRCVKN